MARGRRGNRGPSLLIPMIVVIFAWLGLSYFAYDLAEKNKLLRTEHAKVTQRLVEYRGAQNENRVEQEKLAAQIGFTGSAPRSNDYTIRRTVRDLKGLEYAYFVVTADQSRDDQVLDPMGRDDMAPSIDGFTAQKDLDHLQNNLPTGFELQKEQVYSSSEDVQSVVAAQDDFINKLIDANRSLQLALIQNHAATNAEHQAEQTATNAAMRDRDAQLDTSNRGMLDNVGVSDNVEGDFYKGQKDLNEFYSQIWRDGQLIERLEALAEARRERDILRRRADVLAEDVGEVTEMVGRVVEERDHYDGTVYFVDQDNRWAYINLGRKDGIKPDMTFNVLRFEHAEQPVQVGIIKVKEVLSDRTSWCDVVTTLDADVPLGAGDKISDAGYWRAHPETFALVGKWGGVHTRQSRGQTEQFLRSQGFAVTPEVNKFTQVVVLGADFREDPEYLKIMSNDGPLFELRTTFKFWRPDELYDFWAARADPVD